MMNNIQIIELGIGCFLLIVPPLFIILWRMANREQRKVNEHLANALNKAIKLLMEEKGLSQNEVQQIFDKPEEITQEVKKIPILKHSAFKKNEIAR